MANKKKKSYDERERLIWGLIVYAGLLKQADMPLLGIPANTVGNWKKKYEKELYLLNGMIDLLLADGITP